MERVGGGEKLLTSSRLGPNRHEDQRHKLCDSFKN